MKVSRGEATLLRGAHKQLKKDFDVWPGEVLLLELVNTKKEKSPNSSFANEKPETIGAGKAESTYDATAAAADTSNVAAGVGDHDGHDNDEDYGGSEIMATFAAAQNTITLRFNHPDAESSANADAAAVFELQVRVRVWQ